MVVHHSAERNRLGSQGVANVGHVKSFNSASGLHFIFTPTLTTPWTTPLGAKGSDGEALVALWCKSEGILGPLGNI